MALYKYVLKVSDKAIKYTYKSCSSLEELQLIIDDYIDYYNNESC